MLHARVLPLATVARNPPRTEVRPNPPAVIPPPPPEDPVPEPTLDRLQTDLQLLTEAVKHKVTTAYRFVSMPTPPGDQRIGVHIAGHYFYDKPQIRPHSQWLRYMWHTEPSNYCPNFKKAKPH